MRHLAPRAVLSALLLLAPALQSQTPSAAPLPHPYRPSVDVLHYHFTVHLPERGAEISARAEITMRRVQPRDSVRLDLIGLRVDSVHVNGAAAMFTRGDGWLDVRLPRGATGDTVRVAVRYGGVPADGLIIRTDTTSGRWTAFGDNWPNRGRHWMPSVDHPSDKATVEWVVTAPSSRRVIANGALVEESPIVEGGRPTGRTLTHWRTDRPLPTYLMVIGVATLSQVEIGPTACGLAERPGCVAQSVWLDPVTRDFLPGPFRDVGRMTELFARMIAPFPYEKLAHVQSETRFGGMENASAIFYSDGGFRNRTLGEGTVAHEIVHQWFGNSVTPREWPHLWLSEGFATYWAKLWTEHARGDSAFQASLAADRRRIVASDVAGSRPVIDTAQTDLLQLLNINSYQKGGWVLHMLRRQVGDSAFFAGLRDYYRANLHGTALTIDLRRAVEARAEQPLEWFFDQWLRRPGWIEGNVGWRYDAERRQVVIELEQGGRHGAYRFPLTVEVHDSAGARRRVTVPVTAERTQRIVLPLDLTAPPRSVTLDPDVDLLATFTTR